MELHKFPTKLSKSEFSAAVLSRYPSVKISDLHNKAGLSLRGEDTGEAFPLISSFPYRAGYEAGISVVFTRWAWDIGWHIECFDYGAYEVFPRSSVELMEHCNFESKLAPGECPF